MKKSRLVSIIALVVTSVLCGPVGAATITLTRNGGPTTDPIVVNAGDTLVLDVSGSEFTSKADAGDFTVSWNGAILRKSMLTSCSKRRGRAELSFGTCSCRRPSWAFKRRSSPTRR